MAALYFAYGSNMHPGRLRTRLGSAFAIDTARLIDYRLAFHKRGADGSAKGDVVPAVGEEVWGVLYRLHPHDAVMLDQIEGPGYSRCSVVVESSTADGQVEAFAYRARATAIALGLQPFSWYLDFLREGARHHGLPRLYTAALEEIPVISDPDPVRHRRARLLLESA